MTKYFKSYLYSLGILLLVTTSGCKKDFGEINTNPAVVVVPDIKYLFTYSENSIVTYQGGEWIWEGMEQLLRYSQHVTSQSYEVSSNVNARYGSFYS
ncbi:MAG: hypothetical protein ABIN89_14585 [Chitinophagaceae bacterium]